MAVQTEEENLYKILGTTARISQKNIKKKYVEMVKKYPPEQHPEQFEKIRHAYETLSDPKKREDYDFKRKYQKKYTKIAEKASGHAESGDWSKAEKLYRDAIELKPDDIKVRTEFIFKAIENDDIQVAKQELMGLDVFDNDQQKAIFANAITYCLAVDQFDSVTEIFLLYYKQERPLADIVDFGQVILAMFVDDEVDDDDIWESVETLVQLFEEESTKKAAALLLMCDAVVKIERWNFQSKVQADFRKLIKQMDSEDDDRQTIKSLLETSVNEYISLRAFALADAYAQLLAIVDPKDQNTKQLRSDIKENVKVEKQFFKMTNDEEFSPLVQSKAMQFYNEKYDEDEGSLEMDLLNDMLSLLTEEEADDDFIHEDFVIHISILKRKYPSVFRMFKEQWKELYEEHVEYVSREVRRKYRI